MQTAPTILRPEINLTIGDQSIVVRDLPWPDALEFLKQLSAHAQDLLTGVGTKTEGGGLTLNVEALLPKLTELITNTNELLTFLITRSTGKDASWVHGLSTIEMLTVLDAALEVNLSDGLIALGKKVGGRLGRVLAAKTSTTPPSATSCSPRATPRTMSSTATRSGSSICSAPPPASASSSARGSSSAGDGPRGGSRATPPSRATTRLQSTSRR